MSHAIRQPLSGRLMFVRCSQCVKPSTCCPLKVPVERCGSVLRSHRESSKPGLPYGLPAPIGPPRPFANCPVGAPGPTGQRLFAAPRASGQFVHGIVAYGALLYGNS